MLFSFSFIDGNLIFYKSASELQPKLKVMQFLLRHDYFVVKQRDNRLILPRALFSIRICGNHRLAEEIKLLLPRSASRLVRSPVAQTAHGINLMTTKRTQTK